MMTEKERVLVIEDPVTYATLVHKADCDPRDTKEQDAIPYYTRRHNPNFTPEECHAIERASDKKPGTLLVRQNNVETFSYIPVANIANGQITDLANDEVEIITMLLQNFLMSLGGKNISIDHKATKTEKEKQEWINETTVKAGKYKGGVTATGDKGQEHAITVDGKTTIENAEPDWAQASHYLEMNPFLANHFLAFFTQAKKGALHGRVSNHFSLTIKDVCTEKYTAAIEVAGKFNLIQASLKNDFEKKVKKEKSITICWVYSVDL